MALENGILIAGSINGQHHLLNLESIQLMDLAAVLNQAQHTDGSLNLNSIHPETTTMPHHHMHAHNHTHHHMHAHNHTHHHTHPHHTHPHDPHHTLPHLPHLPKLPKGAVKDFVGGLIYGIVHEDHFAEIDKCLKNGPILEGELTTAVTDFKNKDILKGIEVMGTVISQLPVDLAICEGMKGDLLRIKTWAEIFHNPLNLIKTVGVNAFKHAGPIGTDIHNLAVDLEGHDFKKAGEVVADLMIQNLGPVPALHHAIAHHMAHPTAHHAAAHHATAHHATAHHAAAHHAAAHHAAAHHAAAHHAAAHHATAHHAAAHHTTVPTAYHTSIPAHHTEIPIENPFTHPHMYEQYPMQYAPVEHMYPQQYMMNNMQPEMLE